MLNLLNRQPAPMLQTIADPSATRADLQIRNLLDCPNLRRVMGRDVPTDRLEQAAA